MPVRPTDDHEEGNIHSPHPLHPCFGRGKNTRDSAPESQRMQLLFFGSWLNGTLALCLKRIWARKSHCLPDEGFIIKMKIYFFGYEGINWRRNRS
jgi:hypothetical protein